jgi:hypothetical protein
MSRTGCNVSRIQVSSLCGEDRRRLRLTSELAFLHMDLYFSGREEYYSYNHAYLGLFGSVGRALSLISDVILSDLFL